MKLEVGKYYKTRNGDKVFLRETEEEGCAGFGQPYGLYLPDGKFGYMVKGRNRCACPDLDIIAEWTDTPEVGPVRTVTMTRQEIVSGEYGAVSVSVSGGVVCLCLIDQADVTQDPWHVALSAEELTDTIATLTAIRDAMMRPEE